MNLLILWGCFVVLSNVYLMFGNHRAMSFPSWGWVEITGLMHERGKVFFPYSN